MAGYVGNVPVPQSVREDQSFTATAGQTTFNTLGYTDGNRIKVTLNGVLLEGGGVDYTATNGSDVVLTVAAVVDDIVRFETFNEVQLVSNTSTTPIIKTNLTLKNDTHEDTDGGRESTVIFSGEQSGGEITTLAEIEASHDGTADDQKGDLIFRTNDGSDGTSPTERLRIDSDGSILTATLGTDNVHLGEGAGAVIVSGGNQNVTIGKDAGAALTTGDNNTAVGFEALKTEDGHGANTAIGFQSLKTQNAGLNAGNTAVGYQSGVDLTTGHSSTLIGTVAGANVTTSSNNTAVGYNALGTETSGGKNTALGSSALAALNRTSDAINTAVGFDAGKSISTGSENTIIGGEAGDSLTVGNLNVAIGNQALSTDINGSRSTAVGATALKIQEASGSTSNNYYNVGFGFGAGHDLTTGYYNTCIGAQSADVLATGNQNVYLGYDTTASSSSVGKEIVIGYSCSGLGTGYVGIGNNSDGRIYNQFTANATWTHTSDERMKKDIQTNTDCGLAFVNDLRTVTYKWKSPSEHPEEFVSYDAEKNEAAHTEKMYGFIAQEVKAAMDTHNITDFAGWHCIESQGGQQGISYEMFVMPLVKAVQELSAKNDALETQNTTQATQIADLITRVTALEAE